MVNKAKNKRKNPIINFCVLKEKSPLLIGIALSLCSIIMLSRETSILSTKSENIRLFVALDCGNPEILIKPNIDYRKMLVTIFPYKTSRKSKSTCHYAIVGSRIPIKNLKRIDNYYSRNQELSIQVTSHEKGNYAYISLPNVTKSSVLEFELEGGIINLDRTRFQFNLTFGHFPAKELSKDLRKDFFKIAPKEIKINIVAPIGFSRETGFPEPTGGFSGSQRLIYRFSLPYDYSPIDSKKGEAEPYYDQSDLNITFLSTVQLERKNYFIIIWSTLLGLGVALLVDAILKKS